MARLSAARLGIIMPGSLVLIFLGDSGGWDEAALGHWKGAEQVKGWGHAHGGPSALGHSPQPGLSVMFKL